MNNEKTFLMYMKNEKDKKAIMLNFPFLFQEINLLLERIKLCDSSTIAEVDFDLLEEIHLIITSCIYVQKINLPEAFLKFFKDFEEVYNIDGREQLFIMIKRDNYSLDFDKFFVEEINQLFENIRACKDVKDAKDYFDCLDAIQVMIAVLICEKRVKVSPFLKQFFREFDHIGEPGEREFLFNKIKNEDL